MNARRALAATGIALTLLSGCSSSSRIEKELPTPLGEFAPQRQVREVWSTSLGSLTGKYDARLAPVLSGDTLYVAAADGTVRALAAGDGRARWEVDVDATVTGATGVGDGLVLVGTLKGDVIALDAASGARRWVSKVSSMVQSAPAARDGVVVVQSIDGKLTGLSAADGKRLWVSVRDEPALSLHGTGAPVIAGDFALAGFASGKIVAVALRDGKLLWEHTVAPPRGRNEIERLVDVDASLLLSGSTLFAVAYQGRLVAIDMRSGRPTWTRDVSSHASMDADRSGVYVSDAGGDVQSFDAAGGSSLWRQDKLHGRNLSGPAVQGDALVVGDFEGYLHWLAREDGRFLARYRLDSTPVRTRGVSGGDTLFVVSSSGRLAALQLAPLR